MTTEIAAQPIVDGLQTNTHDFGNFSDRSPLGDKQNCLNTLERAFIIDAFQGSLKSTRVVSIEAKF
jgi:hypothetical protein